MPEVFRSRGLPANSTRDRIPSLHGARRHDVTLEFRRCPRTTVRDITDGTSNTIGVFETAPQDAVAWTRPDGDITFNPAQPLSGLTNPGDYFLATMFDSSVRSFDPALDPSTFDEFVTRRRRNADVYAERR